MTSVLGCYPNCFKLWAYESDICFDIMNMFSQRTLLCLSDEHKAFDVLEPILLSVCVSIARPLMYFIVDDRDQPLGTCAFRDRQRSYTHNSAQPLACTDEHTAYHVLNKPSHRVNRLQKDPNKSLGCDSLWPCPHVGPRRISRICFIQNCHDNQHGCWTFCLVIRLKI